MKSCFRFSSFSPVVLLKNEDRLNVSRNAFELNTISIFICVFRTSQAISIQRFFFTQYTFIDFKFY